MCLPLPVEHPCGMSPEGPLFRAPLTRFQFRSCEFGHLLSGMRPGFANVRTDFSRSQRRVFAAAINLSLSLASTTPASFSTFVADGCLQHPHEGHGGHERFPFPANPLCQDTVILFSRLRYRSLSETRPDVSLIFGPVVVLWFKA